VQTLTYLGPHHLEWREVVDPAIGSPVEALIRPIAVATCDLDTGVVHGQAPLPGPFEFGHEQVGEVVSVGDAVTTVARGDLVIVPFQISCGTCARCVAGQTGSCLSVPKLSAYGLAPLSHEWGGALADLVRVPFADAMLVPLPQGVDPVTVASMSDNLPDGWRAVAGPLARNPGAPVLVLGGAGAGSIGLYAAAIAVALGAESVDYVDTDEVRLRVAETLGASPIEGPWKRKYGPYPIVVNHTSDSDALRSAIRSVEANGILTSTSIYFEDLTGLPLLEMYTTGVTVTTSRVDARASIPAVLELVTTGRLQPELVTTEVVAWSDAAEALAVHRYKTVVSR
jgi:threonine dehydrogenase-like Zn-dependent dehydrogenase